MASSLFPRRRQPTGSYKDEPMCRQRVLDGGARWRHLANTTERSDCDRCGFPTGAPSGGGRRNFAASTEAAAARWTTITTVTPPGCRGVRWEASTPPRDPVWSSVVTTRTCFTPTPTTPASTTRCRRPSPKLTGIPSKRFLFIHSRAHTHTHTHTHTRLTTLFRDCPGEPVPER